MGQKTNPIGNRLGFIRGWDSNWYGGKDYTDKLVEDDKIRTYLMARLRKASVSNIIIERTLKLVTVTIKSARPGVIIGKGGSEVDKLREELKKLTGKDVQINIFEIKRPELDARLVAESVARQIEARISHRRAIKMAIAGTMRLGAEGIKINIAGRVNGAEIARSESYKEGRIPCTPSVPTSTTRWWRPTPPTAASASSAGSAAVKFMASVTCHLFHLKRRIAATVAVVHLAVVGALVLN